MNMELSITESIASYYSVSRSGDIDISLQISDKKLLIAPMSFLI